MKNYKLTTGILSAKISRFTENYVILKFSFEFQEPFFLTLPKSDFNGLDYWIKENYYLAK
jgi:hypothetical protein